MFILRRAFARVISIVFVILCLIVLLRVAGIVFKIIAAVVIVLVVLWVVSQFVKRND